MVLDIVLDGLDRIEYFLQIFEIIELVLTYKSGVSEIFFYSNTHTLKVRIRMIWKKEKNIISYLWFQGLKKKYL